MERVKGALKSIVASTPGQPVKANFDIELAPELADKAIIPTITIEWCQKNKKCADFHLKHWKFYYHDKDCGHLKSEENKKHFKLVRDGGESPIIIDWN